MKNTVLTAALLMLASIASWAQQTTPLKPFNLPDCNLPGIPFMNEATSVYQIHAQHLYALLMNTAGASVAITDSSALASVNEALANGNEMQITGYVAGVSVTRDGKPCISFSEKLSTVTAVPWFRWDKNYMVFLRTGCRNPVLVYAPSEDKGGGDKPPATPTAPGIFVYAPTFIYAPVYAPTFNQPPVVQSCCKVSLWETVYDAHLSLRHVTGDIRLPQGTQPALGISILTRKVMKHPDGSLHGKPLGIYAEAEVMPENRSISSIEPPCDTCPVAVPLDKEKRPLAVGLAAGVVLLGGTPFEEMKSVTVRASLLARYETKVKEYETAGWTGFSVEAGVSLLVGKPTNAHLELSLKERCHPKPLPESGNAAFVTVLELSGVLPFDAIGKIAKKEHKKAVARRIAKHEARAKKLELKKQQTNRDSMQMDSFLRTNPLPIINMGSGLEKDSTDTNQIANAKQKVFKLQNEYNKLLLQVQARDVKKWLEFKKVRLSLVKASDKLDTLKQKQTENPKKKPKG